MRAAVASPTVATLVNNWNKLAVGPQPSQATQPGAMDVDAERTKGPIAQMRDEIRQHKLEMRDEITQSLTEDFQNKARLSLPGLGMTAEQVQDTVRKETEQFRTDFQTFSTQLEKRMAAQEAAIISAGTKSSGSGGETDPAIGAAIAQLNSAMNANFEKVTRDAEHKAQEAERREHDLRVAITDVAENAKKALVGAVDLHQQVTKIMADNSQLAAAMEELAQRQQATDRRM